jgi:hypothetical protein
MMSAFFAAAAVATSFTTYPAFEDPTARIEAIVDKGPIAELIVRCNNGTARLTSLATHRSKPQLPEAASKCDS